MCVYVYVCVSVREREINRLYLRFDAIISIDIDIINSDEASSCR